MKCTSLHFVIILILRSSVSCKRNKDKLFTSFSHKSTGIVYVNKVTYGEKFNVITYGNFYNGGGVVIGDINNDGLPDIYFTSNQQKNKLYLNKGNFMF